MTTELDAITIFIDECDMGCGIWVTNDAYSKISLFMKPFKGLGTKCLGCVAYHNGAIRVYENVEHNMVLVFKGDLFDPCFFDGFRSILEVLRG